MTDTLSHAQKESLFRDGYIVLKKAVSDDLVDSALNRIKSAKNCLLYTSDAADE